MEVGSLKRCHLGPFSLPLAGVAGESRREPGQLGRKHRAPPSPGWCPRSGASSCPTPREPAATHRRHPQRRHLRPNPRFSESVPTAFTSQPTAAHVKPHWATHLLGGKDPRAGGSAEVQPILAVVPSQLHSVFLRPPAKMAVPSSAPRMPQGLSAPAQQRPPGGTVNTDVIARRRQFNVVGGSQFVLRS